MAWQLQRGLLASADRRRQDVPGPPHGLRITAISATAVTLAWHPAARGPRAARYEILRDGRRIGRTRRPTFTDRTGRAGHSYRYAVRAIGGSGRPGRPCPSLLVHLRPRSRPPDTRAPTVPGGVGAVAQSESVIALSWRAAQDNVAVAAYDVFRDGARIASVTATSLLDTGLAAGTSYGYQVAARDAAGNRSGLSSTASATTAVGPGLPALMSPAMVDRVFWRAGFGPSPDDRTRWVGQPATALVDHLLTTPQSYPSPSTPPTVSGQPIDPLASNNDLVIEWLTRMQTGVNPLTERLTLFWHRHFAVARSSGIPPQWLLAYRDRLQRYGNLAATPTASFRDLAVEMTTQDGAMSYFLTGDSNVKAHPNENYAREFMELFCLGVQDAQGNPNYTQTDVQQLARAFTGWRLDQSPSSATYGQTSFDAGSFDAGTKTILGQTGAFTAAQAVDVVLAHPAHAPFLLTKLWHEFILAPVPPATLADLVATYTAQGNLRLAPVIRKILTHPLLFESLQEPNMIKPPIVFYVGLIRAMDAPLQDFWPVQTLTRAQQLPYDPPNVAGWEGGLSWLNTSTAAARFDSAISSQYLKYRAIYIDQGGAGETAQQAFDRAYASVGSPWLSDPTRQLLLSFAAATPGDDDNRRRERQYALRAFMIAGPDAQVM